MIGSEAFKKIPLFSSLSEAEARYLLDCGSVHDYPPNAVIFSEGDTSDHFSVVLEGQIDIIKSRGTDVERLIKSILKDDFYGEMSVLYDERSRSASAVTASGARVFEIPVKDFDNLVRQNGEFAYRLMKIMLRRLRETEGFAIEDLKEKNRQLVQSLKELKEAQAKIIAKEKLEFELATAREIQESMLPDHVPVLEGWEMEAHWQPARSVSGDFYDFISLPDGRLAIIVGDVTDKGVPAALIMTVTRSMMRAASVSASSPAALLTNVNNLLSPEVPMGMFITCHVSFLDPTSGRLAYASAGHCRPFLRRGDAVQELRANGLALGIYPDIVYEEGQVSLEPGDLLLFYSDGLLEAHNQDGAMFGTPAIKDLLLKSEGRPIAALLAGLAVFTGDLSEPEDDITLVSLLYRQRPQAIVS